MALPENQVCSDCPERQPRWASLIVPPPGAPPGTPQMGAFCCLECSGSHRRLGVHISFVRSINLDSCKYNAMERCEIMNEIRFVFYDTASSAWLCFWCADPLGTRMDLLMSLSVNTAINQLMYSPCLLFVFFYAQGKKRRYKLWSLEAMPVSMPSLRLG
jgi:Putative GTPase activating protein for Arf